MIRTLSRAYATEYLFSRFAASGLAILFGVQAAINMSVNLQLIPAKGMTLPFVSYGGSSIISLAYGVGMMLALTRLRPRTEMELIGNANAAPITLDAHGSALAAHASRRSLCKLLSMRLLCFSKLNLILRSAF